MTTPAAPTTVSRPDGFLPRGFLFALVFRIRHLLLESGGFRPFRPRTPGLPGLGERRELIEKAH
jgi:hypothetical protein